MNPFPLRLGRRLGRGSDRLFQAAPFLVALVGVKRLSSRCPSGMTVWTIGREQAMLPVVPSSRRPVLPLSPRPVLPSFFV